VPAVRHDGAVRTTPRTPTAAAVQRRLELGLGAVRGVTLAWGLLVAAIDASSGVLRHPVPALVLLGVLVVWSVAWTVAVARRARWVGGPLGVGIDLVLASVTVAADQFVYAGDRSQSLASAWPLAAVLASGVAAGPGWGLVGGVVVGLVNVVAAGADGDVTGRVLALLGSTVLYGAAGWVAGWVAAQLRTTAAAAAEAEARAEVARTLHDGVLQTLAVVQRRSDDPELVELSRAQDAELRAFLRGTSDRAGARPDAGVAPGTGAARGTDDAADVAVLLGPALAAVEGRFGVPTRLVVVDPGDARGDAARALVGAAAEAATNAAKHSGSAEVWVSVDRGEPSGTLVVVHDEGHGFDPRSTPEGDGLTGSVRGRLDAVGGTVAVRSAPGEGCEVTLWAP